MVIYDSSYMLFDGEYSRYNVRQRCWIPQIHRVGLTSRVQGMEDIEYEDIYPFPVCVSEMEILSSIPAVLIACFYQ